MEFRDKILAGDISQVTHVATGRKYYVSSKLIINATNSESGQKMVQYMDSEDCDKEFVRELEEFCDGRFEETTGMQVYGIKR